MEINRRKKQWPSFDEKDKEMEGTKTSIRFCEKTENIKKNFKQI